MQSYPFLKSAIALAVSQSFLSTTAIAASIDVGTGCTLSQAITAANSDTQVGMCAAGSGADTINLGADSTIELSAIDPLSDGSTGLPSVISDIVIQGNGSTLTRADMAPAMRLLRVNENASLTIESLTLSNGSNTKGSAILANRAAQLTLIDSTVTNNVNTQVNLGGNGIDAFYTNVRIENSVINQNTGQGTCGISQRGGDLELIASQVIDNSCASGLAGVSFMGANLTIHDSTVSRNTAGSSAGFISRQVLNDVSIERSAFDNNQAARSGLSLKMYNTSTASVDISNTTVSNNSASSTAGLAIFYGDYTTDSFSVSLDNVTASNNTAASNAGALISGELSVNIVGGTIEQNKGGRFSGLSVGGSGYYNLTARGTIKDITISGNVGSSLLATRAGVQVYDAQLRLENVTITGGAGRESSAINVSGENTTLDLVSSQISDNNAISSTIHLVGSSNTVTFSDTLIADNYAASYAGINASNLSQLDVTNSTFARNAGEDDGGAIRLLNVGTFNLSNSTLSGNSSANGGALFLDTVNQTAITNTTFSGNQASSSGASLFLSGSSTSFSINNTVFAEPGFSTHCSIAFIGSVGVNNWFDDESCTSVSQGPALLDNLSDNGGPTPTHLPLRNSPLRNAGAASICEQAPISGLDQRGEDRGSSCDIGAVDRPEEATSFYVIPTRNGKTVVVEL